MEYNVAYNQVISPVEVESLPYSANQNDLISVPLSLDSPKRKIQGKGNDLSASNTLMVIRKIAGFNAYIAL